MSLEHDVYNEGHPHKIASLYAALEGFSKAVELFPVWERLQVAKIEALEAEAAAFSKLHGINYTQ